MWSLADRERSAAAGMRKFQGEQYRNTKGGFSSRYTFVVASSDSQNHGPAQAVLRARAANGNKISTLAHWGTDEACIPVETTHLCKRIHLMSRVPASMRPVPGYFLRCFTADTSGNSPISKT